MKIKISILLLLFININFVYSQPVSSVKKIFGAFNTAITPPNRMGAASIIKLYDNNLLVGGTFSYGFEDATPFLLKCTNSGDTLWSKFYNTWGISNIYQTKDSGFIFLTGDYYSVGWNSMLIRTDLNGDTLWSRTYIADLFDFSQRNYFSNLIESNDGSFIVSGNAEFHLASLNSPQYIVLSKIDSLGHIQWMKGYRGNIQENEVGLLQEQNGNKIILANTYSSGIGYQALLLIKTDSAGTLIFSKAFGKPFKGTPAADFIMLPDSNLMVCGNVQDTTGKEISFISKIDLAGNLIWTKTYDWINTNARAEKLNISTNGNILLFGSIIGSGGGYNTSFLLNADSSGNYLNSIFLNNTYSNAGDFCVSDSNTISMMLSSFDTAIQNNYYENSLTFLFMDPSLPQSCTDSIVPVLVMVDSFISVPLIMIDTAFGSESHTAFGMYSPHINDTLICSEIQTDILEASILSQHAFRIFPNPSSDNILLEIDGITERCKLTINDMLGKERLSHFIELQVEEPRYLLNITPFSQGMYLLTLENGDIRKSIKFIKR